MYGKRLKEKLASGETVFGTFFHHASNPALVEALPEGGLDFAVVTAEHNALDLADFLGLQFALHSRGIACLARIHSRDPEDVAKACDSFGDGVVIPYAEDVEELKRLVGAAKYRPLKGAALERVIREGEWPSEKSRAFVEAKCANTFFCAMTESVDALENLDAICAIPGIDALLIGPNDLTVSLGIPEEREHPKFWEAIGRVIDTGKKHGIAAGVHFVKMEHIHRELERGARFVPFSNDFAAFRAEMAQFASAVGR